MSANDFSLLETALNDAYTVERELGGGGMSTVLLAEERALGRRVVIKMLPPEAAFGLSTERFRREIQLVARLQHPNIVPLLAAGEAAGRPFFTMPFVQGRSLRQRLDEMGAVPVDDAVRLLRAIASALEYAHGAGVVHRDIKPDNVLVSHGTAIVTDFGVAKALATARQAASPPVSDNGTFTALGTSLGTPAYIAPEQAAGDPATDHRADIYSFGALAYELLSGAPPFAGRAAHALIVAHLTEAPAPLRERAEQVPSALAALVHECLHKDPAARPQSATDIVSALDSLRFDAHDSVAAAVPPAARRFVWSRYRRPLVLAAATLLAGGAGATWAGGRARSGRTRAPDVTAPTERAPESAAIAVLPLATLGSARTAADDDYFADGMTDELTDALGRVAGLRVVSRTSAFAFKHQARDVREISRALHVGTLLEGQVRRDGRRLRVSVQLTSGRDGVTLWSDTYERRMRDVFAVQDEIATAVATALQARMARGGHASDAPPQFAPRPTRRRTPDLTAYDLYLRGRHAFHARGADSLHVAARYFAQAIARDSTYAEAYAGLADVAALLPIFSSERADSAYRIAVAAAAHAVRLDSTLAEAHATLALVYKGSGRWAESEDEFRRAIARDPTYATAHQWYAELLIITGRVPAAVLEMQTAAALDPMSPVTQAELAYALGLTGDVRGAIAAGQRGITLDPTLWTTHAFLGYAYLFNGRAPDAVRELSAAVQLDRTIAPLAATLAYAYAAAGDAARARALAAQVTRQAEAPDGSAVAAAIAAAAVDDTSATLRWLDSAITRRDPWLYAMSVNAPLFDRVRGSGRFVRLVRRMNLDPARMTRAAREGPASRAPVESAGRAVPGGAPTSRASRPRGRVSDHPRRAWEPGATP